MKNKKTRADFTRFSKRNKHKRRAKENSKQELIGALESVGVKYSGAHFHDVEDFGRRGRISKKRRADEVKVRGIFSGSKSGFGFVTPEEGYDRDIFIPENGVGGAIDSDLVEIVYHKYFNSAGDEKTEGRVLKIIEEGRKNIVGTLTYSPSYRRGKRRIAASYNIVPDDPKINLLPSVKDIGKAKEGDKVVVKIKRGTGTPYSPNCEIVSVLGDSLSKEANYSAVLVENGVQTEFSEEELEEAEKVAKRPVNTNGRISYVGENILTMDSESAKDLDDAVSLKRTEFGWILGVHIADVSYYVDEKSVLERCAVNRGTSIYFVDKVIPMLPAALSNGACSLNAGEDKYALSAFISLDKSGNILDTKIEQTVIRSKVRGVYSEINKIFSAESNKDLELKYSEVLPTLKDMKELYSVLLHKSEKRGTLDMEIAEPVFLLDENGNPCDIIRLERGVSERIIEQFMLTANEAVATMLYEREIPCVYRVHENPPEEKLREFLMFAHNLGFDTRDISAEKPDCKELSKLLKRAEEKGLIRPLSYTLLRSMSKAKYSEIKARHFGLSIDSYCHFTSPIRRFSDLATHRIIHKIIFEGKNSVLYSSYAKRASRAATEAEIRAVTAERKIENLYKTVYMSDKIGDIFSAIVSSVTSFGIFAELENTCEGLIPISEMPGLFIFDEKNLTLRCSGFAYHLGDIIKVKLEEADTIRGKLRFSLVL